LWFSQVQTLTQTAANSSTAMDDGNWVQEWSYGLSGVPNIFFFFFFFFFWTYLLILTGEDAVPNGREQPNATEW
jgi:hypothetical protein